MNIYWAGGLLIAFVLWSAACATGGYKYESAKCTAADAAHDLAQSQNTIAAEQKVVKTVQTQNNISQEASKEYAKDFAAIDSMYAGHRLQQPPNRTINGVPTVRGTPAGTCTRSVTVPTKTEVYKLTLQQCDQEEAKFNALWNWANRQAVVR